MVAVTIYVFLSEIGNAPDITFRLHNPVVQPELRNQGFRPHSFYVPGNDLAQDWMTLRSAMMAMIFRLF